MTQQVGMKLSHTLFVYQSSFFTISFESWESNITDSHFQFERARLFNRTPPPSLNIIVNINQFGLYGEHDWSILLNWSIYYQIFPINISYHTKYSEAIFSYRNKIHCKNWSKFIHVVGVLNRKITINKTVFEKEAFILKEKNFSIHTHDIQWIVHVNLLSSDFQDTDLNRQ